MPVRASLRFLSFRAVASCTVASVVLAACGGASDSGLFDGPSSASSPDSGAVPSTGDDTNEPVDAGKPSKPQPDAGHAVDAAPSVDANPGIDSAPEPPHATIDCNVNPSIQTCDAANSVCCRTTSNSGQGNGNTTFACTAPSACAQQGSLAIPCDNADDCAAQGFAPGTVCCVTEDANSGTATSVVCAAPSACAAATQTTLCNETNVCPNGLTCATSTGTIPGYKICRM